MGSAPGPYARLWVWVPLPLLYLLLYGKFIQDTVYQILSESTEVCRRYDKNILAYFFRYTNSRCISTLGHLLISSLLQPSFKNNNAKYIHVINDLDSSRRGHPFTTVDSGVDPEHFTPGTRFTYLRSDRHSHIGTYIILYCYNTNSNPPNSCHNMSTGRRRFTKWHNIYATELFINPVHIKIINTLRYDEQRVVIHRHGLY